MTDIDVIVRDRLDRRYPPPERQPDWDDVLERLARSRPAKKPKKRYGFALAGVAAAAALLVALIGPWRESPSFTEQALAAIGKGRYVHAVFQSSSSYSLVLDLGSGDSRPIVQRAEVVYDTKTKTEKGRWSFNGVVLAPGPGGTFSDPAVIQFATGYSEALKSGRARIVGETTVDGRKAKIIRFPNRLRDRDGKVVATLGYEDVAVAADSYAPLWVRPVQLVVPRMHLPGYLYAYPCPCTRVVSISSSDQPGTLPTPNKPPGKVVVGDVTDVRQLDPGDASSALGHTALWAGRSVGGAALWKIRLQRVATYDTSLRYLPEISHAPGLRLDYRGGGRGLEIYQVASPQGGYSFGWSYELLPPPGQAFLTCSQCQTPKDAPRQNGHPPRIWVAQFRQAGLFVAIRSMSRSLVVEAARALAPIP
jgi:hypothetical protein